MGADRQTLRYLSCADVAGLGIAPREVIEALERAFAEKAAGSVEMPPKIGVHSRKDAFIHAMPAYLGGIDAIGMKWVSGYPSNAAKGLPYLYGLAILSDADSGRPLCVMDATWMTELRTAAASVLGIRYLVNRAPETVAVIGCGKQGRVHLELLEEVFPSVTRVQLYDPHEEAAMSMAGSGDTDRHVAATVQAAVSGADIVVTAAPIVLDPRPEVQLDALRPGCVVCAIDFDASVDPEVAHAAQPLVVDDLAQYRHYRGLGYFGSYPTSAVELTEVIASSDGERGDGVALYVPLGLALEDVAVAAAIYGRACETDTGTLLEL